MLFENYQDICSRLSEEDVRFIEALVQLVKRKDVIGEMVEIYIRYLLENLSDERIRNIACILARRGANFTASTVSNQFFGYAIASAITSGIGMKTSVNSLMTKISTWGAGAFGLYGYVQYSARTARELKNRNPVFYSALYNARLEMLYFIIDPVIRRVDVFLGALKTDEDIASDILRMAK